MLKTEWKPKNEIEYSLRNARTVAILTCSDCARLYETGGDAGIEFLKELFNELGKEVVIAETIEPGCFEDLIKKVYASSREVIARSDALVVSSCPAGVKTACICDPGVPVVGVLDPVGVSYLRAQCRTML